MNDNDYKFYLGRFDFLLLFDSFEEGKKHVNEFIKLAKRANGAIGIISNENINCILLNKLVNGELVDEWTDIINDVESNKDIKFEDGMWAYFEESFTINNINDNKDQYMDKLTSGRCVLEDGKWVLKFEEIPDERSIDDPEEPEKFEEDLFESMRKSMNRIINDDHTVASFQSIFNGFIKIAYPNGIPSEDKDKISAAAQTATKGILDMITAAVIMISHEAVMFYDDYNKKLITKNNREISDILNNHMSEIQVLRMKFADMEKKDITGNLENQINK